MASGRLNPGLEDRRHVHTEDVRDLDNLIARERGLNATAPRVDHCFLRDLSAAIHFDFQHMPFVFMSHLQFPLRMVSQWERTRRYRFCC